MREPPDYDAIEQKMWKENAGLVPKNLMIGDENIVKKMETYIRRFGYSFEVVFKKILHDKMFAAHFSKEPRRQGIHEKTAADWLVEEELVRNFRILPKSGINAYYIDSDGEIRMGMKNPPSKSLDFHWISGGIDFYASHKYTKEGGGNQDSQFKEMRNLLSYFQGSAEIDKALIIIVDGPYYTEAKMDDLRRFLRDRPPRSYACPIQDVPGILEEYSQ